MASQGNVELEGHALAAAGAEDMFKGKKTKEVHYRRKTGSP